MIKDRHIEIYKLYWRGCKYFYIGRSCFTKYRYQSHIAALKKLKHSNKKLQSIYNQYGEPKIKVIADCKEYEMKTVEAYHIYKNFHREYSCNKYPVVYRIKAKSN